MSPDVPPTREAGSGPDARSPVVRTVLGDVAAADLRSILSHEHLLMMRGWPIRNEPDFRLDSVDAAVEEVARLRDAGGHALVEMTPLGFGRDPDGLRAVARATDAHVVACTGFHKLGYYADDHWLYRYEVETIASLLRAEVEDGMDRFGLVGPVVDRSEACAGVIKLATEYHRAGPVVERLVAAVGQVHLATGVPVATHTEKGTMGHEQLDLLEEAGVPPTAVVLGHIDHNPDAGYLTDLAARGAYLAVDRPGRIKYAPDSDSLDLLRQLADRGVSSQVLLASDLARRSYWPAYGGGPGLDYLHRLFVPRARREGLGELVDLALGDNARRAFSIRPSSPAPGTSDHEEHDT